jgi:hypothetical protein
MKTFTATNNLGFDIFHIIGNKDQYTITESGGTITYESVSLGRKYIITGNELVSFNRTDGQGASKYKWVDEFAPFSVVDMSTKVSVVGTAGTMTIVDNDTALTIDSSANTWCNYQNLPTYLQGAYGTTNINDGNITFTINDTVEAYLLRRDTWSPVDLTGWTNIETQPDSNGYFTTYSGDTARIYKKILTAGNYTLDNTSAMYIFKLPES